MVDNGLVHGPPADNQQGVCAGSLTVCEGADGWVPDYRSQHGYEQAERSCDELDNDCDGATDGPEACCETDFVVTVPPETPVDDTIYIAGDVPQLGDREYDGLPLEPGAPLVWLGQVELDCGSEIRFRITRGTHRTVETGPEGQRLSERVVRIDGPTELELLVEGWRDTGPRPQENCYVAGRVSDRVGQRETVGQLAGYLADYPPEAPYGPDAWHYLEFEQPSTLRLEIRRVGDWHGVVTVLSGSCEELEVVAQAREARAGELLVLDAGVLDATTYWILISGDGLDQAGEYRMQVIVERP